MLKPHFIALAKLAIIAGLSACQADVGSVAQDQTSPNIILVMSDDQGWGDVAYNGNPIVKTPSLDAMASEGVRLDRFYAAAPVCSPTRASVLTGRHPFRYGIEWAGEGHLPEDEITIAEVLKANGYRTGMFGKWHVGELSRTVNQSYFPGDQADPEHYAPPWENGFDETFATESMVPTYNPYYQVGGDFGSEGYRHIQNVAVEHNQVSDGFRWRDYFWTGPGQFVDEWLGGDVSEIVMDRAIEFIETEQSTDNPFLAVIWFHTPHTPVVAGNADRGLYPDQEIEAQHWFGALSAMDRQVGRLRARLRELGISDNTIVWFSSDNGPSYIHDYNSAGPFKGKKAELTEGGVRVPSVVEWPAKFDGDRSIDAAVSTSDIYPTLLAAAGIITPQNQPALDGENVLSLIAGEATDRHQPIAFQSPIRGGGSDADKTLLQYALSGDRYKLISGDGGASWELYDLQADPSESNNIADQNATIVRSMRAELDEWRASVSKDAATPN
jgi:arylsulfatase A-like enzyme